MRHAPVTRLARRPTAGRALAGLVGALCVIVVLAGGAGGAQESGTGRVLVSRVDDPITPVIADHVGDVVERGERDGYDAVIIELDTPGGLDTAMRDIVQRFLAAEVPVVVFVSPSGARAASAGALIAWASHVVAMAPGTTIGAATPVALEGGEVGDKVVNDAAAYARAVAEERGRNVDIAEAAVTEGEALSASEAVEGDAADLIAGDRAALLEAVDGLRVELADGRTVTLQTAGAGVDEMELSPFRRVLQWLADPNLAFLFLSLGTLGIIYELATPGIGGAGGAGIVFILLALFGLAVLPIDAVGFLFLVLAVGLFVAELFAPGLGVAAGLGAVALALSGFFLFREDSPGLSLSLAAVLPTVTISALAVVVAGRLALRARTSPTVSGPQTLVGQEATVTSTSGDRAQALVDGAWWTLRSDDTLSVGDQVLVRDVDGLDLLVEKTASEKEESS